MKLLMRNVVSAQAENDERDLVLARLEILPADMYLSSGGSSMTISRDEMIEHVAKEDDIGKEFIKIEMKFLRSMKSGDLYKRLEQFEE